MIQGLQKCEPDVRNVNLRALEIKANSDSKSVQELLMETQKLQLGTLFLELGAQKCNYIFEKHQIANRNRQSLLPNVLF